MDPGYRLNERVKELTALHEISKILYSNQETYERILLKIVSVLVNAFQFPETTSSRITFGIYTAQNGNFRLTDHILTSDFNVNDEKGMIEVVYLEEKPQAFYGPFLKEERQLLDSAAQMLAVYLMRRQKENELNGLLQRKELMLKEIHHRVKNNLQIILSLLRLQGGILADQDSKNLIKSSENRVKALSVIHEKLYGTPDLKNIDYKDCIRELLDHLLTSYSAYTHNIRYELDCAKLPISIDQAIPLGLIINELVTNSIRHAFTGLTAGLIIVKIICDEKFCTLEYSDNGLGISSGVDVKNPKTLGYQLINSLASQLDGKLSTCPEKNGFNLTLIFPYKK